MKVINFVRPERLQMRQAAQAAKVISNLGCRSRQMQWDETGIFQGPSRSDLFKQQMRESLRQETPNSRTITIAKKDNVYTCGDQDEQVYFVESGQIKLLMLSPAGKECLIAIHAAGDIFGELGLSGLGPRLETATAMEESVIKQIPCSRFFERSGRDDLLEGFIHYLAMRIADQQQVIANLATIDSEHRLGKTLLRLARKLGRKDPCSLFARLKITHEELSEMVGTTRPRISSFMQRFRILGLIETTADHFLIVKEKRLVSYLAQGYVDFDNEGNKNLARGRVPRHQELNTAIRN